ncbi:Hypothetical protein DEACI_0838 [Acididesulfobacillus acetoxydans]|uniref:Uncharacterized protein n=1 Tax=Acididesulfobacillus acetoxydans TaxID=1561005 RepID=A0A8S0XAP1_9FIRM|nr:Hypothetical protein DEACI_0838 [Acididesulfobacillus acetoxydans]CEJ09564.1 Hypothetical protein DEACI_4049 [Acididesulfobacillus acetoxydans]
MLLRVTIHRLKNFRKQRVPWAAGKRNRLTGTLNFYIIHI